MSGYRRICMYCGSDMGPAGPDYTGNTHGCCLICFSIVMAKMDTQEDIMYRPTGRSEICDAYDLNPRYGIDVGAPRLIRCQETATTKITVETASDVRATKRCQRHADELRAKKQAGATFEVLEDTTLESEAAA